jgi:hypothetical protein
MNHQELNQLEIALGERVDLCNEQVEQYKQAEQLDYEPPNRHAGWLGFANEANAALTLLKQYASVPMAQCFDDIPAQVAAELRSRFGNIDLARHIEANDLRAIDCNTPD